MTFAYADPPYIGQAKKHYSHDPNCAEVDHKKLVDRLYDQYPDGWVLSLSSPSLYEVLPYCLPSIRVMAWAKQFSIYKPNVGLAYTWEPVLLHGGRKITRQQPTVRDHLSEVITLKKGLVGAKPRKFAYWMFQALNIDPEQDAFVDLYPGTGGVMEAYHVWSRQKMFHEDSE